MKKRILSMLLAIVMVLGMLSTTAWATNISGTISSNVTWNDGDVIDSAVTLSGGSEGTPMVVTVSGTVTVNAEICVTGNVRITGGGKLVRNKTYTSMLKVSSGAQLTLDNITVCGNDVSVYDGNAIYVSGGSLEINEGTTLCHHLNGHTNGSAIKASGGFIEMNGGLIENNTVQSYGTIYLNDYAEFEFNGGMIRNNKRTGSTQYGGGAFYVRYGTLTMNGGTISGHDVGAGFGGAIYCTSYGTVNLNGGSITENKASQGDAVFFSSQQGKGSELYIGGNPYIAGSIYLDSSEATKYPYITSAIKTPLTLVVEDAYQDRIIAVGHDYTLTESDMAKITLSVLNGSTPYYAKLDSTNNRLLMTNADLGYTEQYYVTYQGNGGTGSTLDNKAYESGEAATVMNNAFQREGYTFSCWNTKADGTGTSYTPGDSISMSEDVTLYAIWQISTYAVSVSAIPNDGGTVSGGGTYNYGATVTLTATPAAGYHFVNWTENGTEVSTEAEYSFTATEDRALVANFERDTYTVKFVNADGTELQSSEVAYGETPVYTGETPTKEADTQYTYTFKGWDKEIATVTGDATYTAQFSSTVNKYTVTFYAEDGTTVLESKEWEYGQNPVYNNGQNPTKPATAEKSYTFAGWTPAVVTVSGNASYTATFTDATNTYTVTWYNEDGTTVLETATWAYGSVPSFTEPTPTKAADAENTYAFKEWVAMSGLDSDGKVTGDASYKASYTATKIDYAGTVSPEEGTMDNVTADGLGEVAEEINKNIVLTVKVEAANANDTEQTAIKGQAGSRTLEFLDITLKDDGGNSVEVPQSIVLEIAIPFTVGNKQNITVYRHHNGIAAAFTALNTKPAADARTDATFYVDSAKNCLYVYTNQFSTYAIGYTVPSPAPSGSYTPTFAIAVEEAGNGIVQANCTYAFSGSTVTVIVTPDKGYVLDKLTVTDIFGREVDVAVKDGKYTFKMPAANVTVKATFKEEVSFQNPFEDVFTTDYYYDAVLWAVKEGITNGTSATTFSPNAPCTRAQMVTFLWHAAGSPEPTATACSFTDVDMDSYYGKAVLWAVENGITNGTSDTTFSPDMECSRAQMATFLCRMAGGKAESDTIAFTDVKADAYYAESVQWAVENGITNGMGDNKFSPNATCTRGQMVTFLYRYYAK